MDLFRQPVQCKIVKRQFMPFPEPKTTVSGTLGVESKAFISLHLPSFSEYAGNIHREVKNRASSEAI